MAARTRLTAVLPPEVAEAGRRKFGVAHRVLNVLVPEPSLQRPGVVAGVGQGVAAAGILARALIRPNSAWKALGFIGPLGQT